MREQLEQEIALLEKQLQQKRNALQALEFKCQCNCNSCIVRPKWNNPFITEAAAALLFRW